MKIRLQKFLAERGIGSRRKIEEMMKQGLIKVNGKMAELGIKVDEGDKIEVLGRLVDAGDEKKVYIMFNKPRGVLSTCRKSREKGKTVLDYVRVKERIYPVGRLDKDSEGLMLLTNDGELALKLTHPRYEHEKQYFVRVKNSGKLVDRRFSDKKTSGLKLSQIPRLPSMPLRTDRSGRVSPNISNVAKTGLLTGKIIQELERGVDIGGYITRKSTVRGLTPDSFLITLKEGKKRQIRRMCEAVGLEVVKLERVRIGGLRLGGLKSGEWRRLMNDEIMKS